jgi:hypothetical protein
VSSDTSLVQTPGRCSESTRRPSRETPYTRLSRSQRHGVWPALRANGRKRATCRILLASLVSCGSSATLRIRERVLHIGGAILIDVGCYWPSQYPVVSTNSALAPIGFNGRTRCISWASRGRAMDGPGLRAVRGAPAVRNGAQLLPVGHESGSPDDQQPNKGRGAGKRRRSRDGTSRDRGWPNCIEPVMLGHQARQAGASVPRCRGPGRPAKQPQ